MQYDYLQNYIEMFEVLVHNSRFTPKYKWKKKKKLNRLIFWMEPTLPSRES